VLSSLLAALPTVDPTSEYVALATSDGAAALRELAPAVHVQEVDVGKGLAWELHGATAAAAAAGADLLFTIRELVGRRSPPTVLHVFEPPSYRLRVPRRGDELKAAAKDALLAAAFVRSARRAAAVTAGSETTAMWLRGHGVDASVVLPGLDEAFFAPGEAATRDEPYLFHVASGDARDLTEAILESLALLDSAAPLLVVAGMPGWRREHVAERARSLGIADRLEFLGWVSDADLRAHYRGALAVAQPSRYEGYGGYPSLEAMALGTPVVAVRAPGATEALEDAALLIDSAAPRLLAEAIRRLADDGALRAELVESGRRRVAPLRWERVATELAVVFRRTLGI
jgi:glycosyltransferase involved in cell wall biosynthesis